MPKRCRFFIEVLKAEMEDLLQDIMTVESRSRERFASLEISNYVFRANEALFMREEEAVRLLMDKLGTIDVDRFTSLDGLIAHLDAYAKELVGKADEPEAVYGFLKRKMDKVLRYVDNGTSP
ncbi:MAG: hypothetical protein NT080_14580 [Spirochaetes bacterium]|nr:hypothetical protein [Spirochaetota bacterium]